MLIDERYKVMTELGSAAFSKVYAGKDLESDRAVAIKMDASKVKSGVHRRELVLYEADVLSLLHRKGRVRGVPRLHWSGYVTAKSQQTPLIVMDRLGDDLESVIERRKALTSVETAHLGIALANILERIHNRGFLHRDIKPSNIMLGYDDSEVYLADFGLAKRYIDETGFHIPYCDNKSGITGTLRFCATNSHDGVESSRRDDLQSLLYVVVYMLKGALPWQGVAKKQTVGEVKRQALFGDELAADLPPQIASLTRYVRGLGFEETPDYNYIRRTLGELLPRRTQRGAQ
mmetsp:Transcript_12990/g.39229  ORF Transcript_12990/g.39229 Transcript_12990/m.39229 type:complete len:289 (-) Transcript_12990:1179-2045(-)